MRRRLLLFLILLFAATAQGLAQGAQCLSYEPAEVDLRGRIIRRTFPGPPNYESIKKGDKPETYLILHLDAPVCVAASADNDAVSGVTDVQLILSLEGYARFNKFVRQHPHPIIIGKLMQAISGHHHTPVLLEVKGWVEGFHL